MTDDSEGERVFVLSPKGLVFAVLSEHLGANAQEVSEELLERLYVFALRHAHGKIPAIAFFDGRWQFVALESST